VLPALPAFAILFALVTREQALSPGRIGTALILLVLFVFFIVAAAFLACVSPLLAPAGTLCALLALAAIVLTVRRFPLWSAALCFGFCLLAATLLFEAVNYPKTCPEARDIIPQASAVYTLDGGPYVFSVDLERRVEDRAPEMFIDNLRTGDYVLASDSSISRLGKNPALSWRTRAAWKRWKGKVEAADIIRCVRERSIGPIVENRYLVEISEK
jgi:hypothetical protein